LIWGGFLDGNECQKDWYLLNDIGTLLQCALVLLKIGEQGRWYKLAVSGEPPSARERHTATLIGKRIYVIGGYDRSSEVYYSTVHYFDTGKFFFIRSTKLCVELMTWNKLEPTGNVPDRRCSHTAVAIDEKIWIFGGRCKVNLGTSFFSGTGVQYRNDLYCFDPRMASYFFSHLVHREV
jgi:hypothetical protein